MHRQHGIGIGSLASYIGEAMDGLPIFHAFIMVEKSFDIPPILFYLASDANKNKQEDSFNGTCNIGIIFRKMGFPQKINSAIDTDGFQMKIC
jgi:hypothetical protein